MRWKELYGADGARTLAVILDTGDEVVESLTALAREQSLSAAHFTAIGALSDVRVAFFDWESKEYRDIPPIDEQLEVLTLAGDVATEDGEPRLHAHIVVGRRDGTAHGGHLVSAHVRPTLEVILTETPAELRKELDEESGLALISIRASSGP